MLDVALQRVLWEGTVTHEVKYPRAIIHLSRIASFAPPTAFCTLPLT
jgi:hypothetical protein